jgi:hypothetical protein
VPRISRDPKLRPAMLRQSGSATLHRRDHLDVGAVR